MSWTLADIPDQSGRRALVTGATGGLGFEVASALLAAGALGAAVDRIAASAAN